MKDVDQIPLLDPNSYCRPSDICLWYAVLPHSLNTADYSLRTERQRDGTNEPIYINADDPSQCVTKAELELLVKKLGKGLRERAKINKGDVVLTCAANSVNHNSNGPRGSQQVLIETRYDIRSLFSALSALALSSLEQTLPTVSLVRARLLNVWSGCN